MKKNIIYFLIVFIYLTNSWLDFMFYYKIGSIYITESLLLLLFAVSLPSILTFRNNVFQRMLVLYFFIILIVIFNLFLGLKNGLEAFRDAALFFYPSVFFIIVPQFNKINMLKLVNIISILCVSLMISIVIGFVLDYKNYFVDSSIPRITGARQSGMLMLGILCLSISHTISKKKYKILLLVALLIFFIISTFVTRNVIIASSVVVIYLLINLNQFREFILKKFYVVFIIVTLLILSNVLLSEYFQANVINSISERAEDGQEAKVGTQGWRLWMWGQAIENTFANNLLFGNDLGRNTGFNVWDEKYKTVVRAQFHNGYVAIFYYSGFIGFTLAIIFFINIFIRSIKNPSDINKLITAAGLFYLVIAGFNVIIESPQSALPFWFTMGLVFSIRGNIVDIDKQKKADG